jgi:hypothetical protein
MNKQTFTDWGGGYDPLGSDKGAINLGPEPSFRDAKDRRLQAFGASPDTQHPDGYLDTSTNSRRDKMGTVRSNTRSYARGVHKGERINPGDYVWPAEFNPMTGLQYEAAGLKFAPSGLAPQVLVNDGKAGVRGVPTVVDRPAMELIDRERQSRLKSLLPGWR